MKITLFAGLTRTTPKVEDLTWDELATLLKQREYTSCGASCIGRDCPDKKAGRGWSPVEMLPGTTRAKVSVHLVHAAVFDIDHVHEDELLALLKRLGGLASIWYSTHNHKPLGDCAVRLVLPLSRPVTAVEWTILRAGIIAKYQIPADPRAKDVSRFFFLPSSPKDGPAPFDLVMPGEAISVDVLLAGAGKASSSSPAPRQAIPALPTPSDPSAVDVARLWAILLDLNNEANRELMKLLKVGKPFAKEGERDDMVNRVMSILACALPMDVPLEVVLAMVRPSLCALPGPEGGDHWLIEAEDCFNRAQERREESDARRDAENDVIRKALQRESVGTVVPTAPPEGTPALAEPLAISSANYSDEELARWITEHGVPDLTTWQRRWIIQHGKAFWVFANGRYLRPITKDDLEVSLRRDLSRADHIVDMERAKADGESFRPAKVSEILADYATVARRIEASLVAQVTTYDPVTQTLTEAVCPRRKITPREHPEIHRWLELLGGEKLLDWVATCWDLSRQTCAIYFDGVKGAGKSLFAHGMGKIWSVGGPTEAEQVFKSFNDGLTSCPLIFADETLPEIPGVTAILRRLIGSSQRNLCRKFLPNANLEGGVRIVFAANNDRLLHTSEDMGSDDVDAVADRILYIHADPACSKYLEDLGGPPVVNIWVTKDLIAEHAMWLAQTRKVDTSGRFLVKGEMSDFHEQLATKTRVAETVVEYLVRKLSENIPLEATIQIGNGELWVNADAVTKLAWERLIPSMPMPSNTRISRVLGTLTKDNARYKAKVGDRQYNYHLLNTTLLLNWVERNVCGDGDRIKARLALPNEVITRVRTYLQSSNG